MSTRLNTLLKFLEEDPHDPFNLYALALEYQKSDAQQALLYFNELMDKHPDYLPAYYHLGKLHQALHNKQASLEVFQIGVEKAKFQQNMKALRELQAAMLELEFE